MSMLEGKPLESMWLQIKKITTHLKDKVWIKPEEKK